MVIKDSSDPEPSEIVRGETLALASTVVIVNNAPATQSLSYEFGDIKFELAPQSDKPAAFDLKASNVGGGQSPFTFKRTAGRPWSLPGPIKSYAFPDRARSSFQNAGFLADLELGYEKQMDRLIIWADCATSPGGTICGRAHDLLT